MKRKANKKKAGPVLRLGTRGSPLALAQSSATARALERAHRKAGLRVELVEISTIGDRDRATALKTFGGTGVFVKELERALRQRRVDFAVHSLKDLPVKLPRGLALAAVGKREDARDVAVTRSGRPLKALKPGSVVGTGSPRRRAQLALLHPHLRFEEIRGNVDTRLRKVKEGAYAATILARAGLKRLKNAAKDAEVLPYAAMLPAPGQGALGIECRANDARTKRFLRVLHDRNTAACVAAERACLAALGGGCHLPLGALGTVSKGKLRLRAVLGLPDGSLAVRVDVHAAPARAESLGQGAARTIKACPEGRAVMKVLKSMKLA